MNLAQKFKENEALRKMRVLRHRAMGGRVPGFDSGGAAAADDWVTPPAAGAAADDWVQPTSPAADSQKPSTLGALWEGIKSGATAGWAPQISGGLAAAGMAEAMPYLSEDDQKSVTGEGGVQGVYSSTRDQARADQQAAEAAHPWAYGAGDIGGAVAPMLLAPEVEGAGLMARLMQGAKVGAGYGALSGASNPTQSAGERLAGAGLGAAAGAVGGAGGVALGTGLEKGVGVAYRAIGAPVAATVRGLIDPEAEAGRRVAGALTRDYPQVLSGATQGLTPSEFMAAKAAGDPVMIGDLGGETTRALMRSAANSSPEGRADLQNAIMSRFQTQNDRAGSTIRDLVAGGANTAKTKAALEADYDLERGTAYRAAYQAGDRPIWSPELERLTNAPSVANALRGVVGNWKDWQVLDRFGGMNPPVKVTPDGQIQFTGGQGMLPYPNLQLWDYAARNLSGAARAAARSGNDAEAARLGGLQTKLKSELDRLVPEFADARGVAAQYFGGNNVIEAGQNALNYKGDPGDLKLAMAKMKPAEQEMFQESYADALARKAQGMGDNRDVTLGLFNSPIERQKIAAVFGQDGVDKLQAFVARERVYDAARKALGNSTTVRQMIEAGLAGGAAGGFLSNGDPRAIGAGVLTGAGASKMLPQAISSGVRTAVGYVDRNTARKVAEMLTSDDPASLARALQAVAKNKTMLGRLGEVADRISASGGTTGAGRLFPQIPGTVAADENQQSVPRPPSQQKNGGAVGGERRFARGGAVMSQERKAAHDLVHYTPRAKERNERCEKCTHFIDRKSGGQACQLVKSPIARAGWCELFSGKE